MNANPYGELRGPDQQLRQRRGVNPVINHRGLTAPRFSARHWRGAGWVVGWVLGGGGSGRSAYFQDCCAQNGGKSFIGPKDFQGKGSGAVHSDLLAEELHTHTYTRIANTEMFPNNELP